jgi:predicted amidophosphoribosyltransferase
MRINPRSIRGLWNAGWALDWHTLSSIPRGDGSFDTTRSEIGEALYQLKYHFDRGKIKPIAEAAADFIRNLKVFPYLKALIPVPPSNLNRPFQPVLELAKQIGDIASLPVPLDYLSKIKRTPALKDINDAGTRQKQLANAFRVADNKYAGDYLLVFDDLFRSGESLNAVCNVLKEQGEVARIYVVTVTMTRTKR